jgi:hypothetical protein
MSVVERDNRHAPTHRLALRVHAHVPDAIRPGERGDGEEDDRDERVDEVVRESGRSRWFAHGVSRTDDVSREDAMQQARDSANVKLYTSSQSVHGGIERSEAFVGVGVIWAEWLLNSHKGC